MNETILKTISELRTQLGEKVEEIKEDERMQDILKIYKTIVALEELAEVPTTSLADVFGFAGTTSAVRSDEFYGLIPLEAAKRFIRKRGRACKLEEIAGGIRAGGCQDVREEELGKSLSRSTMEIAVVGDDLYGLTEFYGLKRERKKKSTERSTAADSGTKSSAADNGTAESTTASNATVKTES